jgi:2-keto-4-pentenoate hydratase/2-oxohepta-3-ene-1,7-dioic acid hydratase in catechol pathway
VPRDELDLSKVRVRTSLNGVVKQDAPVTDLIFPVDVIIEYVTQFMTLEPGDLIATGTPPGVGPMQPGDTVQVDIEGIGTLQNPVIRG